VRTTTGEGLAADVIVVGTGFASVFFLHRLLQTAPPDLRVLVLERGAARDHAWYLENRDSLPSRSADEIENRSPDKPWIFTIGVGGGSNCWWGVTPRMLPEDFALHSTHGVGVDWPIGYDDLESHYTDAELLMAISGPERTPYPRSRPYPLPPHTLAESERLLAEAYPDLVLAQPTARASREVPGSRPQCCANGVCSTCPIDAKFTVLNGMATLDDERVTLLTEASAEAIEVEGGTATGVRFTRSGREEVADADLVVVGANAIFNPWLLARSGLDHPALGRGLVEQTSVLANVDLDGVESFSGSTSITAHLYNLYAGEHRSERAAALIESANVPLRGLRMQRGRWRQRMELKLIYEDLRQDDNRVTGAGDKPVTEYRGPSDYTLRSMDRAEQDLESVLDPLPVEEITAVGRGATESHVLGTTVMGTDPADSIVDADSVHHDVRNLVVLGGSTFPTAAPANPTLTIAALSLRAATRLS
jgi:choline dehydrogenase-like flavoprotein